MQYIYSYSNTIPLFKNHSEGLENTSMYNSTLKLYKGFNNVIKFKIRDRDRRSITFEDKSVKIVIINQYTDIEVTSFYLSPDENDKIVSAKIEPSHLEDIEEGSGYLFMAVLVDDLDQSEELLYIDHDFGVTAPLEVLEAIRKPIKTEYHKKEQLVDNFEKPMHGFHYFHEFIKDDESVLYVEFESTDNSTCDVFLEVNNLRYAPIDTNANNQWEKIKKYYDVGIDPLRFDLKNEKYNYYRIVIETDEPEKFFYSVYTTSK